VKLLGITITRTTAVEKLRAEMRVAASQRLIDELRDKSTPVSRLIASVARSAAKDHFEQMQEDKREAFEADPEFQEWARQRREHDLAEAEKAQPTDVPGIIMRAMPIAAPELRYGLLGYIGAHGYVTFTTLFAAFPGYGETEIRSDLELLRADGLIREEHGGWLSTWTQPRPVTEDGQRDANPDSQ
jgi:hypothetical protein